MLVHIKSLCPKSVVSGILVFVTLLASMVFVVPEAFAVSNFQFDAESKTVKMGESVEIPVKISTDKDLQVKGADLWLIFDQTAFEIQNINPGDFFTDSYNQLIGEKLYVAGFFNDTTTVKSGDGLYATIYMTPKKTGTTQIKFDCRGNEYPDTSKINVNPQSPQNIIDCSTTSQFVLNVTAVAADGTTGDGVPTATPGLAGGAGDDGVNPFMPGDTTTTLSPTPSTLPDSGMFDNTLYYLLSGGIFIGFGGILKKLYS